MQNLIRNELLILLGNEGIHETRQIRICAIVSKYLNNVDYLDKVKSSLDLIMNQNNNFFTELPILISLIIDINKNIISTKNIDPDDMRFIIYGILYHYLDTTHSEKLNSLNCGDLRLCFLNNINLLLMSPTAIKMSKLGLFSKILNCICGDDNIKI